MTYTYDVKHYKTEHDSYIVTSSSSAALVALAQRGKRPPEQKFRTVTRSLIVKCERTSNRFIQSRPMAARTQHCDPAVMQDYLKPALDLHACLSAGTTLEPLELGNVVSLAAFNSTTVVAFGLEQQLSRPHWMFSPKLEGNIL